MKINRFLALAAIALLVVGVMGGLAVRSFAQTDTPPAAQPTACAADAADANEGADAEAEVAGDDADTAECQDAQDSEGDANEVDDSQAADSQADEAQDAAPAGSQPAITAAQAQQIAEDYLNAGPASAVELDDENGTLVYGVEFNGTDVKVDANTGEVLGVETGQD